jgi:protein-S-isoprenylcysteine O-methyltransferase Ste14
MGIGVGIVLIVLGLIGVTGAVTLPEGIQDNVAGDTLGWIFLVVGILAIILSLVINQQRQKSTYVEERRTEPRPPVQ